MSEHPQAQATISEAVLASASSWPENPALHAWQQDGWRTWSYAEVSQALQEVAYGLVQLGIQPDDRIALLGPNSPEWGIAFLGILAAGAIAVPLDRMQAPAEWLSTLQSSEPVAVIAAMDEGSLLEKELVHAPSVRQFIALSGPADPPALTLQQVRSLAKAPFDGPPVQRRADDLAAILYTSGTTGHCKGVMLSHNNILSDARAMLEVFDIRGLTDRFLSVLPMSHCYECTSGFLCPLLAGAQIFYARGLAAREVIEDLRTSRATFLLAVPLFYEKIVAGIERGLRNQGGGSARIASGLWAVSRMGRSLWKRAFGRVTLKALRNKTGFAHIRYLISGGAPLSAQAGHALQALGLRIIQGYGLTETSPVVTLNPRKNAIPDSVGVPLPGVEIKIHEPDFEGKGEIWIKGPIVTRGYWLDPESTDAVFEDGWFRSGDVGRIGPRGYLYITGRSKHLIVTSGGKNISPEEVEIAALRSPFIAEIIVYGAKAKDGVGEVVSAQVYPDYDYLNEWAKATDQPYELQSLIRSELDRTGSALAHYKRIIRFTISETPFQKTSSHKIKRHLHKRDDDANAQD